MTNSLKKALALTALTALAACSPQKQSAVQSADTSIIGGEAVAATDTIAKSTVSIVVVVKGADGQQGEFLCTGSLLTENIVLTAAHCVPGKEYSASAMFVIFSRDINEGKFSKDAIRKVSGVAVHPKYGDGDRRLKETIERLKKEGNPTGQGVELSDEDQGADNYDIALIKVDGKLPEGYAVANVLQDESILKQGAKVTLSGYGLTEVVKTPVDLKTPNLDEQIAKGEVQCNFDKTACYTLENKNENILKKTDVMVMQTFGKTEVALDQSKGKGACHGDSGGPAFINVNGTEYLWGVTSRGTGQDGIDDCSEYSLYTKVHAQSEWIEKAKTSLQAAK